jgi:hypothetical protein
MPRHFSTVDSPLVKETSNYNIHDLNTLNWMMIVKCPPKVPSSEMDRDIYCSKDFPLETAIENIEEYVDKFFYRNESEEGIKLNKKYHKNLTNRICTQK